MTSVIELLRQGRRNEVWDKCCGFIDLSLKEFMGIQERLLMEEIQWLGQSELGKKIMGEPLPNSVEQFRQQVPLTTYSDYAPYLLEKREEAFPEKPAVWVRSSGRGGEYPCKWAPVFKKVWDVQKERAMMTAIIFASCSRRGDVALSEGDSIPYCMAPPPYGLGWMVHGMMEAFPFVLMPSEDKAIRMTFQERIEVGFRLALREGIDHFLGLASILVKVGQQFSEGSEKAIKFSFELLHPKVLYRLVRGLVKSRLAGRPMYPKDLWKVKGIVVGGTDTSIFKEQIAKYWGREPLEMYAGTEMFLVAIQTWDYAGMTFLPDLCFLEFIPEDEHLRSRNEPGYQPRTVLLSEVQAGKKYEMVFTTFGGVFVRYRVGDMVKITALRNERLDIDIPQMVFEARCDDIIDLAGFTRMTEKVIWQAIENAGIGYEEWTVRKEIENSRPVLHVRIEPKRERRSEQEIRDAVHQSLKNLDSDYRDIEEMLGYQPLRVTLLSPGTFERYVANRQAAGVEPAHFKPPHMVTRDEVIDRLVQMSSSAT